MLKRIVRHRLFQAFLVLALIIAGLGTPIRHDYSTMDRPNICSGPCSEEALLTEVQYGVPFVWLKLDKEADPTTHQAINQNNAINPTKLLLDLASYAGVILLIAGILKLDDRAMHASLRH